MSGRAAPWRNKPSQEFQQLQAQLSQTNRSNFLYMLQRLGPASFIIGHSTGDEQADTKYKVILGNVPSCSCTPHGPAAGREPCIHLLFVLMRIFRVPANNALLWQSALTDRELQDILDGRLSRFGASSAATSRTTPQHAGSSASSSGSSSATVQRRPVEEDEPCPICYEPLSAVPKDWLVWCSTGCGRSIHGKCMRIWSDHQTKTLHQEITCPLCRCAWGVFDWRPPPTPVVNGTTKATPNKPHHRRVDCAACKQSPIEGARYRCLSCPSYNLCESCFQSGQHLQHSFACLQTPTAEEYIAERPLQGSVGMIKCGGCLPASGRGGNAAAGPNSASTSSSSSSIFQEPSAASSSSNPFSVQGSSGRLVEEQSGRRGSNSSSVGSGNNAAASNIGIGSLSRRHGLQQHQQLTADRLQQLQQQELVIGSAAGPLQQQSQHSNVPQRHSPARRARKLPPAAAAGAAAIARELQALAISGVHQKTEPSAEGAGQLANSPARLDPGPAAVARGSCSKPPRVQKPASHRGSSAPSGPSVDSLSSLQLFGSGPRADGRLSEPGETAGAAAAGRGSTPPAAGATSSISASSIGSIGARAQSKLLAAAAAAADGAAGDSLGPRRLSKSSSSSKLRIDRDGASMQHRTGSLSLSGRRLEATAAPAGSLVPDRLDLAMHAGS